MLDKLESQVLKNNLRILGVPGSVMNDDFQQMLGRWDDHRQRWVGKEAPKTLNTATLNFSTLGYFKFMKCTENSTWIMYI